MQSRAGKTLLKLTGGLAVVAASFFTTLEILKYRTQSNTNSVKSLLQEPPYSVAALPRLRSGQSLNFSSGQNRSALLAGWSGSEPTGVWSAGHAAFIGFVVDGGAGQSAPQGVAVRANVFLGSTGEQRVQVWSGTKQLAEYSLKKPTAELAIPLGGQRHARNTWLLFAGFHIARERSDGCGPPRSRLVHHFAATHAMMNRR
jgi:hypothetical protein